MTPGQASRIYKTLDGGETWLPGGDAPAHCDVRDLFVDPSAPDVVYASGIVLAPSVGCLFRSEDGGAHWASLTVGTGVTHVVSLARDAQDLGRLVVATNSGVWESRSAPDRIFDDRR
ncbi:MAG: hypothetical protein ABI411_12575 [Tahibacter sp.]